MNHEFSPREREQIYELAASLTGACVEKDKRRSVLEVNVRTRMRALGLESLSDYLAHARRHSTESDALVSLLTIHTTHWFREAPHFEKLRSWLEGNISRLPMPFQAWTAACSTGEEVFSLALLFEDVRRRHPGFDYRIVGTDIDPLCIRHAQRMVYSSEFIAQIPQNLRSGMMMGTGVTRGYMTLVPEIRSRCRFQVANLVEGVVPDPRAFHFVSCRNVLIYFDAQTQEKVFKRLAGALAPQSLLCQVGS